MILIIGYGNSLRQDDGAGLILAELLEQGWRSAQVDVERISVHQLTPELAVDIAREKVKAVVFVDTRATKPDSGLQVRPLQADTSSPSLGHYLDPNILMVYARLLYGKQPPAWQVTVPGTDFDHGEALSRRVEDILANSRSELDHLSALLGPHVQSQHPGA